MGAMGLLGFKSVGVQEELAYEEPDKKFYHLCIVNLVIG